MKLLSDRIGHMRQHQHFADRLISKYQALSLSGFPISRLIYRKQTDAIQSEEIHHHSMNVQWTNITQMTVVRPLMIRQHYFLRTLAIPGVRQPVSDLPFPNYRMLTNSAWMTVPIHSVTYQQHPLIRQIYDRQQPSSAIVVTPERILQSLGINEWWNDPSTIVQNTDNEEYPYNIVIDDHQILHEYREFQNVEQQQFAILRSFSRQTSSNRISRKMILSIPALLSKRLPLLRLALPISSPIRNQWQRRSEEMERLARIFNVTELKDIDQVLGKNHTINLLTILPPAEWISPIGMPSIWPQRRTEPIRDSEDWLYHIVRLFNPSERRAVIEQNIRKLYIKASERSLHQNARQWSQTVLSTVWHEMSRTSPTHLSTNSPFIRKDGKWIFDPQTVFSLLESRNEAWNSLVSIPWLRDRPSDQTIHQHLYHPWMIRRYLSNPEQWGRGSNGDTPVWQDHMYNTINQYINIEADRFAQQYLSHIITAKIPFYSNHNPYNWNPMTFIQSSNTGVNDISNASLFRWNTSASADSSQSLGLSELLLSPISIGSNYRQSILHPLPTRQRAHPTIVNEETEQETGKVLQMITKRLPTILPPQSPLLAATEDYIEDRTPTSINWRQSTSVSTISPSGTVTAAEMQDIRTDLEHQFRYSGRGGIQPNEFNRLVDRVYRELQRKLKFDYQRRGM